MRLGKLKESVWQRSVEKQLHKNLNRYKTASLGDALVLSPEAGSGRTAWLTAAVAPVRGWILAPERLVARALASAAACRMGSGPDLRTYPQLHISAILPPETEEQPFKKLVRDLDRLAWDQNMFLFVDRAEVSPAVTSLLLYGWLQGPAGPAAPGAGAPEKGRPDYSGWDICMAGDLAAEGTALIAAEKRPELEQRYTRDYIDAAGTTLDRQALKRMQDILAKHFPGPVLDLGQGGVFGGLWELAVAARVGLSVELKRIPVRQHTIELCEYYRLNPYKLHSGGNLLILCEDGPGLVDRAGQAGVRAAVIGRAETGNDRTVSYDDEVRYLEPPDMDEIYKIV